MNNTIALYGGTFDPVHWGHLKPVTAVAEALGIEEIKLIPAHIPPHKSGTVATAKQRQAMLLEACKDSPLFEIDDRELRKHAPSYTIETLIEIKTEQPDHTLFFFIGLDSLLNLHKWHRWQELLEYSHLIVSTRPGYQLSSAPKEVLQLLDKHLVTNKNELFANTHGTIWLFEDADINISSTEIRDSLSKGIANDNLMPEAVINYIEKHKLYRSSDS